MSVKASDPKTGRGWFSPVVLIRVSAILFVGLVVGHMSAYPWASTRVAEQSQLVGSMKAVDFVFAGEHQTFWGLYFGWGVLVAVLLITMAIILWLLSDLAPLAPRRVGTVTGLVALLCLIGCYISFRFFFVPPAVFFAVASVVLLTATVQLMGKSEEH